MQIPIIPHSNHKLITELLTNVSLIATVDEQIEIPWEEGTTIATILTGPTGFRMRLPVRLHRILFWTLLAFPLLLTMLAAVVLLDASQVAQCTRCVMVHTAWLRAQINAPFGSFLWVLLFKLPWQVVAPAVELEVLLTLESLPAYLANKPVCGHECSWWECNYLSIRICMYICFIGSVNWVLEFGKFYCKCTEN